MERVLYGHGAHQHHSRQNSSPAIGVADPYPLSIEEQRLLFSELAGHLANMALFKVNTGLREQEVVNLRWSWETPVRELDTSVFVIPRSFVKNGLDRYVVLNRVAKSVIDGCRSQGAVGAQIRARDDALFGPGNRRID